MSKLMLLILVVIFLYSCKTSPTQEEVIIREEAEVAVSHDAKALYKHSIPNKNIVYPIYNTEEYQTINENIFFSVQNSPLSTFSIDVDKASYSNTRRFLNNNQLPPKDAVRIEELINYFNYDYPEPIGKNPFSVNLELGTAPWNENHDLLKIGIKGKKLETSERKNSNLVFLLDVSGSMNSPYKLPLLKDSLKILVENLTEKDTVSIVVYAGSAGLVLEPTKGNEKKKIIEAFNSLNAVGSTAGGEGIKLAYEVARKNFIADGNNRVILATDGDFNVGVSNTGSLIELVKKESRDNIYLTILGFGMGNYKDGKMEEISNKGNGNYAYIDNILEAKKALGKEFYGSLYTIAKDVKIQIEFNPNEIKGYRLIGYENRVLNNKDFNNDKEDAGDIGASHNVTAFYELIPADSNEEVPGSVDNLEYQQIKKSNTHDNLMTLKLRYKKPQEEISNLIEIRPKTKDLKEKPVSNDFLFASSVAEFGLLLRDSKFKYNSDMSKVIERAKKSKGKDTKNYRAEFIHLAEIADILLKNDDNEL